MLHERETSAAEAALGVAYDERFAAGRALAVDDVVERTLHAPVLDLPPG